MKRPLTGLVLICLAAAGFEAVAADHPQLKAFPPPVAGMQRFVIVLPHKEPGEEDAFALELVAGRQMPTDGVNLVRLGSAIEARSLKGWGYTYYEVTGTGTAMSTLMAPPPGASAVTRFVTGTPLRIPYNSRLPVVIYAPVGYEIGYRVWTAPAVFAVADRG